MYQILISIRVMAENDNGIGDPSATQHPVRVSEEPGTPSMFVCTEIAMSSVKLQWSKPDYDGGNEIVEYIIEQQKKGEWTCTNQIWMEGRGFLFICSVEALEQWGCEGTASL